MTRHLRVGELEERLRTRSIALRSGCHGTRERTDDDCFATPGRRYVQAGCWPFLQSDTVTINADLVFQFFSEESRHELA